MLDFATLLDHARRVGAESQHLSAIGDLGSAGDVALAVRADLHLLESCGIHALIAQLVK